MYFPVTGEWYNFCKEGMPEIITATHLEVPHSFGLYTNFYSCKIVQEREHIVYSFKGMFPFLCILLSC